MNNIAIIIKNIFGVYFTPNAEDMSKYLNVNIECFYGMKKTIWSLNVRIVVKDLIIYI